MNLQNQEAGINILNQFMNKRNIPAHYVIIKHHDRIVLLEELEVIDCKILKTKYQIFLIMNLYISVSKST